MNPSAVSVASSPSSRCATRGRVADQGGQVGGDEHLVVADADDQRAAVAGHHDPVGVRRVQDRQPVGALHPGQGLDHLPLQRLRLRAADQVRQHLGVGVGDQVDTGVRQPGPQRGGVVDDPVVHDGDVALGVDVRVRVDVVRRPVGRPAGVADADLAGEPLGQLLGQVAHPAGLLRHPQPALLARAEHGDTRRVVAPVLQPAQPLQQQRRRLLAPDVPDDPAHVLLLSSVDDPAQLSLAELGRSDDAVRRAPRPGGRRSRGCGRRGSSAPRAGAARSPRPARAWKASTSSTTPSGLGRGELGRRDQVVDEGPIGRHEPHRAGSDPRSQLPARYRARIADLREFLGAECPALVLLVNRK